jgi:hypothetical protein
VPVSTLIKTMNSQSLTFRIVGSDPQDSGATDDNAQKPIAISICFSGDLPQGLDICDIVRTFLFMNNSIFRNGFSFKTALHILCVIATVFYNNYYSTHESVL